MLPLIPSDQFRAADCVTPNHVFQCSVCRRLQVWQHDIERDQFVKVAVASYWRARASVAHRLPIVLSLQGARRKRSVANAFRQSF